MCLNYIRLGLVGVIESVDMANKKINEEVTQKIREKVVGLLALMNRVETEVEISVTKDQEEEKVMVKFLTDDPGPMIGFKGKHLAAMQMMLGLMVNNSREEWIRILVDVNEYRDEQKTRLEEKAVNFSKQCLETGQAVGLERMSSYERRIIHMTLADVEGVETASEGEGEMRRVIIRPMNGILEDKQVQNDEEEDASLDPSVNSG